MPIALEEVLHSRFSDLHFAWSALPCVNLLLNMGWKFVCVSLDKTSLVYVAYTWFCFDIMLTDFNHSV